ncbi:ATP-binding cassette domain-containing protein [Hyalangium versicolor]|uniref:ATP-binding cassette domain-containing protein n=1 Tax=Hyalangium versicolor TaxID=2861190 RepID=UPI001CCE3759|nr:ATP-binding cassette domain-containing protein [Hyalangium versicolor]
MSATPLLALRGISKRFGAVQALTSVDFEVHAGEVVALVGDNGAGKSTLIKVISGINPIDEGQVLFDGRPVSLTGPQASTALGIATVYQDLALCDNLDVVGNLFLGRELRGAGVKKALGWLDETAMEQQASDLLKRLSVSIPSVRTQVAALSGGQRQSIAVARAMMGSPKVVLLDEPTAALGVAQTKQVLDLIRRLREQGLGVVVISHNMVDVFSVSDRIIVMRLGKRVATFDVKDVKQVDVVAAITGVKKTEVAETLHTEAP